MAEILRFQLQQEATKEAYNRQEKHISILQQKQFLPLRSSRGWTISLHALRS